MTSQIPERLLCDEEELDLCDQPLSDYWISISPMPLKRGPIQPPGLELARSSRTSCWRRYVGTWKIRDNRLYLINIAAKRESGEELTIQHLFPNAEGDVFANWWSGVLHAGRGDVLHHADSPEMRSYAEDIFFTIESGVVRNIEVRKNAPVRLARTGVVR